MRRRTFLIFSLLSFFTRLYASKKTNQLRIIRSILEHLLSKTPTYSGASSFKGYDCFLFVVTHPTFNRDDLKFILEGADQLDHLNEQFMFLNAKHRAENIPRISDTTTSDKTGYQLFWIRDRRLILGDPIAKGIEDLSKAERRSNPTYSRYRPHSLAIWAKKI